MKIRSIGYVVKVFPKLSETFVANELMELQRRGIELCIYSLTDPTEELQHERVRESGLLARTTSDERLFCDWLRQTRPQLLHAHFATDAAHEAWRLSERLEIPFSFTAHGYDVYRRPPTDFAELAAAASRVITVSEANAAHIHQTWQVPRADIEIIPCGIDTRHFAPAPHLAAAMPEIVCVARLVPVKNLQLLLHACSLLRATGQPFHCSIIGEGRCRDNLSSLLVQLQLENHVTLHGALDQAEVIRWWQKASVGVLCSQSEGMPVALMEAASVGVPVVATSVGGVPELVEHEVTGLVTPPDDATALAEGIGRILNDRELADSMRRAARQRALARFSVEHQADRLLQVWQSFAGIPKEAEPCRR